VVVTLDAVDALEDRMKEMTTLIRRFPGGCRHLRTRDV
jgi:hypothetical protein